MASNCGTTAESGSHREARLADGAYVLRLGTYWPARQVRQKLSYLTAGTGKARHAECAFGKCVVAPTLFSVAL